MTKAKKKNNSSRKNGPLSSNSVSMNLSAEKFIKERGRKIPIEVCYLDKKGIKEVGSGTGMIVRLHEGGRRTVGLYFIDTWCRGVFNTIYLSLLDEDDYEALLEKLKEESSVEEVSYEELHNWIFGAVEFAREAGIEPCRSFAISKYLLEDDENEDIPIIEYEFGDEGKHHLVVETAEEGLKYYPTLEKHLGKDYRITIEDEEEDS
ncbi:MAG: hypothetical protein IJ202_01025 [Bacteroidales bacterium]|nr:hypothetical protein [Bacteroidales bacterium]